MSTNGGATQKAKGSSVIIIHHWGPMMICTKLCENLSNSCWETKLCYSLSGTFYKWNCSTLLLNYKQMLCNLWLAKITDNTSCNITHMDRHHYIWVWKYSVFVEVFFSHSGFLKQMQPFCKLSGFILTLVFCPITLTITCHLHTTVAMRTNKVPLFTHEEKTLWGDVFDGRDIYPHYRLQIGYHSWFFRVWSCRSLTSCAAKQLAPSGYLFRFCNFRLKIQTEQ